MERISEVIKRLNRIDVAGAKNLYNIAGCIKELRKMEDVIDKQALESVVRALEDTSVRGEKSIVTMYFVLTTLDEVLESMHEEDGKERSGDSEADDKQG